MRLEHRNRLKEILNITNEELQVFLEDLDIDDLTVLTNYLIDNSVDSIKRMYNNSLLSENDCYLFNNFINETDNQIINTVINLESCLFDESQELMFFQTLSEFQINTLKERLPKKLQKIILSIPENNDPKNRDFYLKAALAEAMKNKWKKHPFAYKVRRDDKTGTKEQKYFNFNDYLDLTHKVDVDEYGTLKIKESIVKYSKKY